MTALISKDNAKLMVKPSAVLTLVSLNTGQIRQRGGRPNNIDMANVRISSLSPSPSTRMMAADNVVNKHALGGGTVRTAPIVTGAPGQKDNGDNGSKAHVLTLARPMRNRQ